MTLIKPGSPVQYDTDTYQLVKKQAVWGVYGMTTSHFIDLAGVTGRTLDRDVRSVTSRIIQYK